MKLDNGWISVDDEHLLPKIDEQCQVLIKGPEGRISVTVVMRSQDWVVLGHTGCTILAHQPLTLAAPPTVPAPTLMQELGERFQWRMSEDEWLDARAIIDDHRAKDWPESEGDLGAIEWAVEYAHGRGAFAESESLRRCFLRLRMLARGGSSHEPG